MKNTFKLLLMTGLLFTISACQTTNSQNNNSGQDPTPSDPGGGTDPEPPGPQPEKNSEWDEEAQTVSISTLLNKGKTTDRHYTLISYYRRCAIHLIHEIRKL